MAFLFCAAMVASATVRAARIPEWLPDEYRFDVSGLSNEVTEVWQTLALMRDALHPKLRAMMKSDDLGSTLQWIVHASQSGMTNEAAYFNTFKPGYELAFDRTTLTNHAARLSYIPPRVKLSLVFDDGKPNSIARAIPGIDYPGTRPEDAGSKDNHLRIALCAPKDLRRFKVLAEVCNSKNREYEFMWKVFDYSIGISLALPENRTPSSECRFVHAMTSRVSKDHHLRVAVFVREKGGIWGPPSEIEFFPDPFGDKRTYVSKRVFDIDYGGFRDVYRYDEQDRIVGFERILPGMVKGERYSNVGECIIDEYADDRPRTTRRVKYAEKDGTLAYVSEEEDVHHMNREPDFRSVKW